MIHRIHDYMFMKAKEIESKPDMTGYTPNNETYKYRYTFTRDMNECFRRLPYLQENLKPGQNVLDIGAGNGSAIRGIQETYQCNITATGIQVPSDALCPFTVAVASDLPFDDNSFDTVISVHGISWKPDQKKAFEEILRVLKSGGSAHIYLITFRHSIALHPDECDGHKYAWYVYYRKD